MHVHQRADHTARGVDALGVDVRRYTQVVVALEYHGDFLLAGVSGALADAVDGDFDLTGAVEHALKGAGGGHAEVVVAMGGEHGAMDAVHVLHEVLDFLAVFAGQAVARRVGDVDHRGARLDHCLHHARQVFVVRAAGVFGVELDVLDVAFGVLDGRHGAFEDFLAVGVELIFNVRVAGTAARVDELVLGKLQRLGRAVYVLGHGACQGANRGPRHGLRNFDNGIEIARARNGEARFNDIHAQRLELFGHLDFLHRVQLAAGHLLAVAQRSVEDEKSVAHVFYDFRCDMSVYLTEQGPFHREVKKGLAVCRFARNGRCSRVRHAPHFPRPKAVAGCSTVGIALR